MIASPGMVATCGAAIMYERALESIAPHSGDGSCTPSPRNERPDAVRSAVAIRRLVWTMIGAKELGTR